MQIYCKSFAELTSLELYSILKARSEVFVVEQQCVYQDIDDYDVDATHIYIVHEHELAAYGRLLSPKTKFQEMSLGRILTTNKARGKGFGKEIVTLLITEAQKKFPNQTIHISAQQYLERFYSSFGFQTTSEVYLEDDIPHIEMKLY